mmetsp:Transcript_56310/g.67486  ORF Transcript_56310/g.67486 Transcript_56310/m.67486 type:complete len:137 (-) Transcript_56310:340-750(-)
MSRQTPLTTYKGFAQNRACPGDPAVATAHESIFGGTSKNEHSLSSGSTKRLAEARRSNVASQRVRPIRSDDTISGDLKGFAGGSIPCCNAERFQSHRNNGTVGGDIGYLRSPSSHDVIFPFSRPKVDRSTPYLCPQ